MRKVGDAKERERESEGAMAVQACDISDQNATPEDRVEWVRLRLGARVGRWGGTGPARYKLV